MTNFYIKITYKTLFILCLSFMLHSERSWAQRTHAVLEFKDGTQLTGLGKLRGACKIKFRNDENTKAVLYSFEDIKSATIYKGAVKTKYVYLYIAGKKVFRVLEEMEIGAVSLYRTVAHGNHVGMGFGGPGGMGSGGFGPGGFGPGTSFTIENYYVRKEDQDFAHHLGSTHFFSKNFRLAASNYFSDCTALVEKIHNKEFRKKDIIAIVEFYNTNCAKK